MNSVLEAIGRDFGAWGVAFAVGFTLNKLAHEFLKSRFSLSAFDIDDLRRDDLPIAALAIGVVGFLTLYIVYVIAAELLG